MNHLDLKEKESLWLTRMMDRFGRQLKEVDGTLVDGSVGAVGCKEMVDFVNCKLLMTSSTAKVVVVGYMRSTIGWNGSCRVGRLKDHRLSSSFYFFGQLQETVRKSRRLRRRVQVNCTQLACTRSTSSKVIGWSMGETSRGEVLC
jgi:hypothetical protein